MIDIKIMESYVLMTLNSKKSLNFHETLKIVCLYSAAVFDLEEDESIKENNNVVEVNKKLNESIKYLEPVYNYVKNNKKSTKRLIENFAFNFLWDEHKKIWGDLIKKLETEKIINLVSAKNLEWDVDDSRIQKILFRLRLKLLIGSHYDEFSTILAYMLKETEILKDYFSSSEITKINKIFTSIKEEEKPNASKQRILKFINIIDSSKMSLNKNK